MRKEINVEDANAKISAQVENIDMRIKKIEHDVAANKQVAMEKKKKKDDRGAIQALRKAKMLEKELTKLEGQSLMLEQ